MIKPRVKLYGFEVHDGAYESCRVREQLFDSKEKLDGYLKEDGWVKISAMAGEYMVLDDCWIRNDDPLLDTMRRVFDINIVKPKIHGFTREFYYDPE